MADESGDRRSASRKGSGREESPDSGRGELARAGYGRATRLVTPGGCFSRHAQARRRERGYGKCHRKLNRRCCLHFCGKRQAKPGARLFRCGAFGKGEKVG